ncbi:hypothetical protein FKO01_05000 [Mesorhizobium sp. B2-3-3]|nr:hypothetical protein FKO01_05000 [Mesorhizobium sp. B2-3-3]
MAKRTPIAPDPRAAELARVEREIADVKARINLLDADERDAADKLDDTRWRAIGKALEAIRDNLDGLETKRAELMAGVYVEPAAPAAPQAVVQTVRVKKIKTQRDAGGNLTATVVEEDEPVQPINQQQRRQQRAWDKVSELPVVPYPAGARKAGDRATIEAAYEATLDWFRNRAAIDAWKAFPSPDTPIGAEILMLTIGTIKGIEAWFSARMTEAEQRIAELESKPSVEYRGVWSAAQTYKHGHLVTHKGSVWHADIESTGLAPGEGTGWKMAVRRGQDGKDGVRRQP